MVSIARNEYLIIFLMIPRLSAICSAYQMNLDSEQTLHNLDFGSLKWSTVSRDLIQIIFIFLSNINTIH